MFQNVLLSGVLATVQSFDGSSNVLSLTLPTERGGGHLTAMILDSLQTQTRSNPCLTTIQTADQTDSCTSTLSPTTAPDCPQPQSKLEIQKVLENKKPITGLITTSEPTPQSPQQSKNTSVEAANGLSSHF